MTTTSSTHETRRAPERIRLPGGRTVAVHTLTTGTSDRIVVVCHAAPGSGLFDPDPHESARHDVTILAVDRPGYGGSDPVADGSWASVDSAADDVASVLDALERRTVGVVGWSAGGRVALALAARRPDLVDRVAVVATPAPNDQVAWIPPEHSQAMEELRPMPPTAVHAIFAEQFTAMVPSDPYAPEALALLEVGSLDADALAIDGVHARLGHMLAQAFTQGATGLAADVAGYVLRPWGFDPADVRAETLLLYGEVDPVADGRHAAWWQQALPDAHVETVPGAGHAVIVPMWHRVLTHVAPNSLRTARTAV